MGNTRRLRKKYQTPSHPWQKERIVVEKELVKEYGLKNKQEVWQADSKLTRFKALAKDSISSTSAQAQKEASQLLDKLRSLGLLSATSELSDVLPLNAKDILERRLQTVVFRKGLARSVKQARQFITHGHVTINGVVFTAPSHMVKKADEEHIAFSETSQLADTEHPERSTKKQVATETQEATEEAPTAKPAEEKSAEKVAETA